MTIVEALKQLVTTMNGSYTADDDTISELLARVDAAFDGGVLAPEVSGTDNGKLLGVAEGAYALVADKVPAVNGTDNGKLLGVAEGAYALVADKSPVVVTCDIDAATLSNVTNVSATYAEIVAAHNANRDVIIVVSAKNDGATVATLCGALAEVDSSGCTFSYGGLVVGGTAYGFGTISVSSADVASAKSFTLPFWSSADSGKVLSVDSDGSLAWATS